MVNQKLNSKQLLQQLLDDHYAGALAAKDRGELIAWSTSIAPQEFCEAMGIYTVYPENHAAAIGAKKGSESLIELSESHGYSADICSYARVNMGYLELQESVAGQIPLPDLLICCNNICNTVIKWYENIARELNIPLIMFDMPFNYNYGVAKHNVEYIKGQFQDAIKKLEEITGRSFDYDRLREVMEISSQSAIWWKKAMGLAQAVPSPMNGFDIFNYMALIVCMRGKKETVELFKLVAQEHEEKIKAGLGPWKDRPEEFRIMWDGIACWTALGNTYKFLKSQGINMVGSTYPDSWSIIYDSNDIDGMARAYSSNFVNRNIDFRVDNICQIVHDFKVDGIIYHCNRSCKPQDFCQYEVQRQVEDRTGIPSVMFDGDQTDPRAFSQAQFENRVQALCEMMKAKKQSSRNGSE
ncbi:MAG: 2-hydroxyacyl-CoA dehydratase [Syntrophomonadaceae bacterium]|jgi:benzoyl-CoA reductase/2-hydroxyglutaryl-CoA dehydratase subunit BcrC/BadD/HgdB|nr:2-hydroxyacyl-CoA dehydratase [Syntrophomonadaceae bacterium]